MGEHCGDEASSDLYKSAQKNMMMMTKKNIFMKTIALTISEAN